MNSVGRPPRGLEGQSYEATKPWLSENPPISRRLWYKRRAKALAGVRGRGMSYSYVTMKPTLFTDEGQRMFLKMRDRAFELCGMAGCVRLQEIMRDVTGDSWQMLACADRMVELGELVEVTREGCAGQYRIFVRRP